MATLLIAVGSAIGFIIAYNTYGRWLARKIFALDPNAEVPSVQMRDDNDYALRDKVEAELRWVHELYARNPTWPVIDVTGRAVEETASRIITEYKRRHS